MPKGPGNAEGKEHKVSSNTDKNEDDPDCVEVFARNWDGRHEGEGYQHGPVKGVQTEEW